MENAHQPSCPGNLLASLLTYQFHQDQQDGITTVFRWEGVRDVGRLATPTPTPTPTPNPNRYPYPYP